MFDLESYKKASTVDDAIDLLVQNPKAILIAGGTDVLVRLHQCNKDYRQLVDIHNVAELKEISMESDGTIVIGSGATFTEIMTNPLVTENIPVLAEGASTVGGPQVRNSGTIGGNLCNGAPSADSAAPSLVLDAMVVLRGPSGERQLPLHNFYQGPGRVDCNQNEIMTALRIAPENYRCWSASYYKYAMRGAMDIATIGCAAACKLEGGILADLRLAYTVAGPTPLRCWKTEEKVRGKKVDPSVIDMISDSIMEDLKPRDSWRASKAFREQIIKTLAVRVLQKSLNQCGVTL